MQLVLALQEKLFVSRQPIIHQLQHAHCVQIGERLRLLRDQNHLRYRAMLSHRSAIEYFSIC